MAEVDEELLNLEKEIMILAEKLKQKKKIYSLKMKFEGVSNERL